MREEENRHRNLTMRRVDVASGAGRETLRVGWAQGCSVEALLPKPTVKGAVSPLVRMQSRIWSF